MKISRFLYIFIYLYSSKKSKKSQFVIRQKKELPGFLLIECLIALLIATGLIFIISLGQKKIIEGQMQVKKEFEAVQKASNVLHAFMGTFGREQKNKQEGFEGAFTHEDVAVISCNPPIPWLTKKMLPISPCKLSMRWLVANKKQKLDFYTVAITQGEA